jgi:hypothetical protein
VDVALPVLFERTWKLRTLPTDGVVVALIDALGDTARESEYDCDHLPFLSCCRARPRSIRSNASCFARGRLIAGSLEFSELLEREANGLVRARVRNAEIAVPELT